MLLRYFMVSVATLLVAALAMVLFTIGAGLRDIHYEIEQEVGGYLIVEGVDWMDHMKYGDVTTIRYRPDGDSAEAIVGSSDYMNRQFDEEKQLILNDGIYYLSAGDRLHDDKIFASRDLVDWREFKFSRDSIARCDSSGDASRPVATPQAAFVVDLLSRAAKSYRYIEGRNNRQTLRFRFTLDWEAGLAVCEELLARGESSVTP